MEKEYFYLNGETKVGPLSLEELKSAFITPATLVWNNTLPDWVEARTLPELESIFASVAPPPPVAPVTPPQAPPYQPYGGGYANQGVPQPPMPDNYLVWAILCTVLCCLPLGIVSILNSTKVSSLYAAGDYAGAEKASADAKKWAIWGSLSGVIVGVIYFVIMFVFGLAGGLLGAL